MSTPPLEAQYPFGSVFCASGPTAIVDVINPVTGKTWMDRNLGASRVALSSNDAQSYGDLYQWGRRSDGHQCRNSLTTAILSNTPFPTHGDFILAPNQPWDWITPQMENLYSNNDPCPNGYRLPTSTELNQERLSWSWNDFQGAITSPLRLPLAGFRFSADGSILNNGSIGFYWSRSTLATGMTSYKLTIFNNNAEVTTNRRADGHSVRCIKN